MFRSRRALFGLLSIAAILVPAAGIAYLGAGSYQSERGLVAARLAEHNRAAAAVAARLETELVRTLDAVAVLFDGSEDQRPDAAALAALVARHPLAQHPFRISSDGRMLYAVADPFNTDADAADGADDAFVVASTRRATGLAAARRQEIALCAGQLRRCKPPQRRLIEVRRAYNALIGFEDTGPAALLGLARIDLLLGDARAAVDRFGELADRYGGRLDAEGIAYDLVAALGRAHATGETADLVAVYRDTVLGKYRAPLAALLAIAESLREQLRDRTVAADVGAELAVLDARLAAGRRYFRFAAELGDEADNVARTAVDAARGRPALHDPARTLVYRRQADGSVVGVVVGEDGLDRVAAKGEVPIDAPAPTTRAVVQRLGMPSTDDVRILASHGFGTLLPHLTLSIVNDREAADPLDEIVRARGQRHLLLTSGLAGLLLLGLWATVRGAARERELARLKSDFVSTVSHELKTPLTSIRMFAEMLQEGVAGGDRDREAHYHSIIVREAERLGLLIANVLDYSQIERGTRRYVFEEERVADVAEEAVDTFRRLREGEGTEVSFVVDADVAEARANTDRAVVVQSMLNLLANAAKYGGREHAIETRVYQHDGGGVAVSVTDRGPGIPRREQDRIFREFYRAPEAYSSGQEGTGLGLALVKRHMEALGGAVELVSDVGRGSTFSIVLPEVSA